MDSQPVVFILGPTACGKTSLSVGLAQRFHGEIISGDSMQVYRGMDIGTAKVTPEEQQGVAHHLIDVLDPEEAFSVADFQLLADRCIRQIAARGHLPFVVGGTGLYLNALLYPYNFGEEMQAEPQLRSRLQEEYRELGGAALHRRLTDLDPRAAEKIHPNDAHRLVRALEVIEATGRPISAQQAEKPPRPAYRAILVGLCLEREALYQRIEQRVDQMLSQGLEDEVRALLARGVSPEANAMQGIGYRQLVGYLQNQWSREEAIRQIKRDTRRFAKRQMTWFKRDPAIRWFDVGHYREGTDLLEAVSDYLADQLKEAVL